ncbi:TPA: hypothetical protein N0F65_009062 [Lagenidium giganteum]|uniref:Uncharacterized protein n=1 Tax=Lagenidium giganteum TaxID=4803 RepID=A0AAV2YPF3_9STRA|nr:TPA: hypothetical protein N0F65_009062 [Lagenidium giganteum]
MQKTTNKPGCFALLSQLACIRVYLTAVNGHIYYQEFQQAGGLQLLLRLLTLDSDDAQQDHASVSDEHRELILMILMRLSQRGRDTKEEISMANGELIMIQGAMKSKDARAGGTKQLNSPVWAACRAALFEQMVGNPGSTEAIHDAVVFMLSHQDKRLQVFGAQILRELITCTSFYYDHHYRERKEMELPPYCMQLLRSRHIRTEHEGLELTHALLQSTALRSGICAQLSDWIKDTVIISEEIEERYKEVCHSTEYETYIHMCSEFVHAAQSINTLMDATPAVVPILVTEHELLIPLAFGLVSERPGSLKWHAAAVSIHCIFVAAPEAAASHLGEIFDFAASDMRGWRPRSPEDLAYKLIGDTSKQSLLRLQFYENGWKKELVRQPQRQEEDRTLWELEHDVRENVRDFVPELQLEALYEGQLDEEQDEDHAPSHQSIDHKTEHVLMVKLQAHFGQFRRKSQRGPKKINNR